MSISAPTLSDILREIDRLMMSLPDKRVAPEVVTSTLQDTAELVGEMRAWADAISVPESDLFYLATFHDALWWADATLARITDSETDAPYQIRVMCRVLEELRNAAVLVRRDLSSQ